MVKAPKTHCLSKLVHTIMSPIILMIYVRSLGLWIIHYSIFVPFDFAVFYYMLNSNPSAKPDPVHPSPGSSQRDLRDSQLKIPYPILNLALNSILEPGHTGSVFCVFLTSFYLSYHQLFCPHKIKMTNERKKQKKGKKEFHVPRSYHKSTNNKKSRKYILHITHQYYKNVCQ